MNRHLQSSDRSPLGVKCAAVSAVEGDQLGFDEFLKLPFEGGAVRTGESDCLSESERFVFLEEALQPASERGEDVVLAFCAFSGDPGFQSAGLPAQTTEKEENPSLPVGFTLLPSGLGATEGEVESFLILLDFANQAKNLRRSCKLGWQRMGDHYTNKLGSI